MIYAQTRIQEKEILKILFDSEIQTNHSILTRGPDLVLVNNKERNCCLVNYKVKMKECEKIDKYLDLAREQKKNLWSMKVTVIPIVMVPLE